MDEKNTLIFNKSDKTVNYLIRSGFKPILHEDEQSYTTIINTDEQLTEICTFLFHNIGVFMETVPKYRCAYESFRVKIDDFNFYFTLPKK